MLHAWLAVVVRLQVQFRRFLTEYGFKLSDEEADELVRECAPKNHRIFYRQYRSMLVETK